MKTYIFPTMPEKMDGAVETCLIILDNITSIQQMGLEYWQSLNSTGPSIGELDEDLARSQA
jgi:hypothetical protein